MLSILNNWNKENQGKGGVLVWLEIWIKYFLYTVTEVQEMEENMPKTCKVNFEDPNTLHKFSLIITPDEGFWHGGKFKFTINIPDEYNILVGMK